MAEILQNNAQTILNGSITSFATTLAVSVATAFPATGDFRISIDSELMLVTSVSGLVFTVTRGVESTSAVAHTDGALVTCVLTAGALEAAFGSSSGGQITASLTSNATNSTTTFSDLTDLSVTIGSGQKLAGRMSIKALDSTPAEGIKFDFNGGSATATDFWAGLGIVASGGSATPATVVAASLSDPMNFATMTGDCVFIIDFYILCNVGGTFIPRFAQNTHSSGTATAYEGTNLILTPVN